MALPTDIIAAIGEPAHTPSRYTDREIGWISKGRAREAIDKGEIKDEDEAETRFRARAGAIIDCPEIDDDTKEYWLKFEKDFFASARKYFAQLREIENSFKK